MNRLESAIYRIIYYGFMKPVTKIRNIVQIQKNEYYLRNFAKLEYKMLQEIQNIILKELKDDLEYYRDEGKYYYIYNSEHQDSHGYCFEFKDFISNIYPNLHIKGSNKYSQMMWKLFLKEKTRVERDIYFQSWFDHIRRYFQFWDQDTIFDSVKIQAGSLDNEACFRLKLSKNKR